MAVFFLEVVFEEAFRSFRTCCCRHGKAKPQRCQKEKSEERQEEDREAEKEVEERKEGAAQGEGQEQAPRP